MTQRRILINGKPTSVIVDEEAGKVYADKIYADICPNAEAIAADMAALAAYEATHAAALPDQD